MLLQLLDRAYVAGARDQYNLLSRISKVNNLSPHLPDKWFLRYQSSERVLGSLWKGCSLESTTGRSESFVRRAVKNTCTLNSIKEYAKSMYFPTNYRSKKRKLDKIKENTDVKQHTATVENIQRKKSTNNFSLKIVSTVNFGCSKSEWDETISRLDNIVVNGPLWPKAKSVSWETRPPLIECLFESGLIPPPFITTGTHWDPCFLGGNVARTYRELGLTIRHKRENFWKVWKKVLTPTTYFISNPPFGKGMKYWLQAFFTFLIHFDRPFLLILPDYICIRKYFRETFSKISRIQELHIWGLNKSLPMKKKGQSKPTPFTGLTIVSYYPEEWNFTLKKEKFYAIFNKKILHIK